MKDFFVYRTARRLTLPLILVFCVLLAAALPAQAAKNAQVIVGFVGAPPQGFQNVLLNVQAVRINPKKSAPANGGGWQKIPTPPGLGGSGQLSELQIDLNASQNIPQLFNTASVKPNTYRTAELLLDPSNPGSIIPNCPQANSRTEGCVSYPISLNNGNVILVTDTSGGGLVAPLKDNLGPLVLQLNVMVNQAPTSPGGAYLVTISMTTVPSSVMATVTGSVTVNSAGAGTGSTTVKIRKLAVTAEAIGTNTAIATARVQTGTNTITKGMCPPSPGGCFTLLLPAAGGVAAPGFGTLYDLAVAGGGDTYAAQRLLPVYPGGTPLVIPDFKVNGSQTLGNITGEVMDFCTGNAINGATLQLLIPPESNSDADCSMTPEQCVTVATANTDNAGAFPLPGTVTTPPQFSNVPILAKNKFYVMKITASGYDDLIVETTPSSGTTKNGGKCSTDGGNTFTKCKLMMTTGYISGTIPIMPPNPGQTTLVQVFAEDTGTNNITGALPMPITISSSNPGAVNFKMLNVPVSPLPMQVSRNFDLFATTIDLYQGFADPYQGHTIAVIQNVPGPAAACGITTATFPADQMISCVGHGSIVGGVENPNLGMSVVLSKQDVQLTNSIIANQSPNLTPTNQYSFCAPADTYQVQEFQLPTPDAAMTPLASPTPSAVDLTEAVVTIPPAPLSGGPSPTPTGGFKCPTSCSNPDGTCPGLCNTVVQALPPTPTATPTM